MRVVINSCHGGFHLSEAAASEYSRRKGLTERLRHGEILRDDSDLIEIVETMGSAANADCSKLKIIEIPDDIHWHVSEFAGNEWVAENHRTWD